MTLLVGDETVYAVETSAGAGWIEAFKYTAVASGVVDTLRVRSSAVNACLNTSLWLALYSDTAGAPDALLASVEVSGTPGLGEWVEGAVSPVAVTVGQDYWLGFLPIGSIFSYETSVASGGTDDWITDDGGMTTPADPWPGTSPGNRYDDGPATFAAVGGDAGPITGLEFHVTGLWYPDAETVDYYGRIADPVAGEVVIPLNDSRTASVTVSVYDPIVAALHGHTYARCLKVYYHGTLVFWGPAKLNEGDSDEGTVRISAVDPSLRAIRHYLRRGDVLLETLSASNGDRAETSIDDSGLRLVLNAARNIAGQTARGCPDIGIDDGSTDFPAAPDDLVSVSRGDPVWDAMLELCNALGPDIELEPVDNTPGTYCQLNTYVRQGTDRTATVQLHHGTGLDNVEKIRWVEGAKYITHAHVLSRDQTMRRTSVNVEASAETGQYTAWDVTDFDSHGIPTADAERVLDNYGADLLKAYGRPLMVYAVTLPVESTGSGPGTVLRYLTDYGVGDTIDVAGKVGLITLEDVDHRITQVTLALEDSAVRPTLDIVPDRTAGDTIGGDE